jgi:hypothetical protein
MDCELKIQEKNYILRLIGVIGYTHRMISIVHTDLTRPLKVIPSMKTEYIK